MDSMALPKFAFASVTTDSILAELRGSFRDERDASGVPSFRWEVKSWLRVVHTMQPAISSAAHFLNFSTRVPDNYITRVLG